MYNRDSEQSRDLGLTVVNSAVLMQWQSLVCRLEPGLVGSRDLKLGLRMMAMLLRRRYWVVRDMNEAVVGAWEINKGRKTMTGRRKGGVQVDPAVVE